MISNEFLNLLAASRYVAQAVSGEPFLGWGLSWNFVRSYLVNAIRTRMIYYLHYLNYILLHPHLK